MNGCHVPVLNRPEPYRTRLTGRLAFFLPAIPAVQRTISAGLRISLMLLFSHVFEHVLMPIAVFSPCLIPLCKQGVAEAIVTIC